MNQAPETNGLTQISMKPIGRVRNDIQEPRMRQWETVVSEVILNPDLTEALSGLEEFSHVVVLFWMHRVPPESRCLTKIHPRGREDLPLMGVLATRSPARPNPLGLTVVRLLECDKNILKVMGLDAIDGTPVLDIKPYLPGDLIAEAKVPDWVTRLASFREE